MAGIFPRVQSTILLFLFNIFFIKLFEVNIKSIRPRKLIDFIENLIRLIFLSP